MKLLWTGVIFILMLLVNVGVSHSIIIIGLSSECPTSSVGCLTIPLTVSAMCGPAAGCPNLSAPSFTDPNRFWGGFGNSCRTSSDGGGIWENCTSSPGLTGGARQYYAGASDGSVIAIGAIATTCTIKRSIDNGTSWVTVYTNVVNIQCGAPSVGGTILKCVSDGRCDFVFANASTGLPGLLASIDNGQNWVLTTVGVAGNNPITMAWDGSAGIETSNTLRSVGYTGGTWSQGTSAFASCGTISGSVVYNGVGYGLCKATGTNEDYRLMTVNGALFKTITLPGAFTGGGTIGALAFSLGTNNLYVIANAAVISGSLPLSIWVSRDDGVSFGKIYTSPQALNSLGQNGDIFGANGCIYFSGGGSPMFGKVC